MLYRSEIGVLRPQHTKNPENKHPYQIFSVSKNIKDFILILCVKVNQQKNTRQQKPVWSQPVRSYSFLQKQKLRKSPIYPPQRSTNSCIDKPLFRLIHFFIIPKIILSKYMVKIKIHLIQKSIRHNFKIKTHRSEARQIIYS